MTRSVYTVLAVMSFLIPAATGFEPRLMPFLLCVYLALLLVHTYGANMRMFAEPPSGFLLWAGSAFCLYLFLNAALSIHPAQSAVKVVLVSLVVLFVLVAVRYAARVASGQLSRIAWNLVWGTLLIVMTTPIGIYTGQALRRVVISALPFLVSERHKGVQFMDGVATSAHLFLLNQNIATMLLLSWPVALILSRWQTVTGRVTLVALSVVLVWITVASESETAKVALVASGLVFLLGLRWPRAVFWLLSGSWCVAVILAVPLAHLPYKAGVQEMEWVPHSARERVRIWHDTAQQVWENPVFGVGIRSTREYTRTDDTITEVTSRSSQRLDLGLHAHNAYLQTWFELGAIGAGLLSLLGVAVLASIRRMETLAQPFGYALFTGAAAILAFGWGMWQTWLLAVLAWVLFSFVVAHRWVSISDSALNS